MASGMDFIGHVAAQAVVWEHCSLGSRTQALFEEAQRSGLFGARPQAAGKRAEEEGLLAGPGELSQALLLFLGRAKRRGRVSRVCRVSSQTPSSPVLSPEATFIKPLPSPDPSPNPPKKQPRPQERRPDPGMSQL